MRIQFIEIRSPKIGPNDDKCRFAGHGVIIRIDQISQFEWIYSEKDSSDFLQLTLLNGNKICVADDWLENNDLLSSLDFI